MWEHKVVSKANLNYLKMSLALLTGCGLLYAGPALSAKTVGDLLEKVKKQSHRMSERKARTSVPKAQAQKFSKRSVDLSKIKPPSSTTFQLKRTTEEERELLKVTDEGIKQLYTLTRRFKGSKKRGELWLRLAELYSEKARLVEDQLQRQYDENILAFNSGKLKRRPKLNLKPAFAYNRKGIQLYEWFIRDFPKDPKLDQALFYLGYNYFEMLDEKKGLNYYQELSRKFPNSKYVSEANFAIGEFYFENGQWKKALPYYKKVAIKKKARLYSFALYKLAWCNYKAGNVKAALKSLERVIFVGRRAKGKGDDSSGGVSRIRLAEEAMKDLVLFYGEAGKPENAESYFKSVSGNRSLKKMLERLAYYYLDTGERAQAKTMFKKLIRDDEYSPKAYDYQYQIVSMHGAAGNDKAFREEAFHWVDRYGPNSAWNKANAKDIKLISEANKLMESTLRNFVLQKHQTAQNSKAENARAQAEKGYDLYFKTFTHSDMTANLGEMHFFYAELLFDMKKYREAGKHYIWVSENAPKSQYAEKALFNSILALDKGLPTETEMKKIVGKSQSPVQFDPTIRSFIAVATKYLNQFPQAENRIAIHYRVGNLYYFYNHFENAIKHFEVVIKEKPDSKYAQWSAGSVLNIYEVKKDYSKLLATVEEFLKIEPLVKSGLGPRLKKIRQNTIFIQAKNMESEAGVDKSAEAFEALAKKNAGTLIGLKAASNAAINFAKAGNTMKAFELYGLIFGSKLASKTNKKDALRFMAEISAQVGRYRRAAELYEQYAQLYPKDSLSTEFLFNAGLIREGILFYKAAIRNYEEHFQKSRSKDKYEVLYRMARIWERWDNSATKIDKAISYYKRYFNSPVENKERLVETAFRIARLYDKVRDGTKARFWDNRVVSVQRNFAKKGAVVGASYAAESKFKLVYPTYLKFRKVKIGLSNAQRSIQAKLNLKSQLEKELISVTRYDDAGMTVASLVLQGQAEQHMAASIVAAPVPKGLTADEKKQYMEQIGKIATPFSSAAITYYKDGIEKGKSLKGYNDWLLIAIEELAKLEPGKYSLKSEKVYYSKLLDRLGL